MSIRKPKALKYLQVYSALTRDIRSGRWSVGDQLPSEAELISTFGVSRITVSRAMRDLQADGLVERRAGAGTFIKRPSGSGVYSFGLLIPDLGETDIFDPICNGMMMSPLARQHALIWGNTSGAGSSKVDRAWHLCGEYIERRVSGVFFAPLELEPTRGEVNRKITDALDAAHIPVVLLDRSFVPIEESDQHDLVGIDNRRAGYIITNHLLDVGCKRILFVGLPNAASTVDDRICGYRDALYSREVPFDRAFVCRIDPTDEAGVKGIMEAHNPDGIACANDRTAGRLMQTLIRQGYRVPRDVRLVGIDDVEYASLLPVPLTTLRQPTRQIGDAAVEMMLERIARPDLPPRDTRLHCELIIRESCGASISRFK
ncbi:MAG TPA: GntR family transcriptional regulator [Steroidobacteraceae bacterium]|nr:GntR family transcriptional regulator [Steroidobacteraceae bacterium]